MKTCNPFVVSVAGMPGAGKSTLIRNAIAALDSADSLHFDEFTKGKDYPNIPEWVRNGCDPDGWSSPGLREALASLKEGRSIATPHENREVYPKRFIFVEEPFGGARSIFKGLVDMVVVIDLPIDIALARRLVRDVSRNHETNTAENAIKEMIDYCRRYLHESRRELIQAGQKCAKGTADLILNGLDDMKTLSGAVLKALPA